MSNQDNTQKSLETYVECMEYAKALKDASAAVQDLSKPINIHLLNPMQYSNLTSGAAKCIKEAAEFIERLAAGISLNE